MKNTILDPEAKKAIVARIAQLKPDSPALWGKMNVAQVLCHLADQFRGALGELKWEGNASFFGRTLLKTLVLSGMPAPKGKVQTMPEIDQLIAGTKPTNFEKDRQTLYALIDTVISKNEDYPWAAHPAFGKMTKQQWCRLAWSHLNHHLKQFGV
jgi:hypothetical protein